MESCFRRIHFCYGHRLVGHEGKCSSLHGHNGVVEIHAAPLKGPDTTGRVIDFSVLKNKVGGWIEEHWDHRVLLAKGDDQVIESLKRAPQTREPFLLDGNPTAENIARHLLTKVCPCVLQGMGIVVYKVVFWETPECAAEQRLEPDAPELLSMYGY